MALDKLTPRERQVLELVATGVTNGETAQRLRITVHAVKFHLAHVYQKLEVTNRVQASMILYSKGASNGVGNGAGNGAGHAADAELGGAA